MTHSYGTWLNHMRHACFICDVTHWYVLVYSPCIHVWYDSSMCDMNLPCATWLIHIWHDMPHSYVTWLIDMCWCTPSAMSCMNESGYIWMSCVTCEWVMSNGDESCQKHDMTHVIYEWVMSRVNALCHMWMSHVTREWVTRHMNESCHI